MKKFTNLFITLDQTNKTNAKLQALVNYLEVATDEDKLWMIALLSSKRPRRSVPTSLLKTWAAETADIPVWLFEESYHVAGDLAETIALVFPRNKSGPEHSLSYWMQFLIDLKDLDEQAQKEKLIDAWLQMDRHQRLVFNKLSSGSFRMGVSQKLMVRALSRHTSIDENSLAHRLMGNWTPQDTSYSELVLTEDPLEDISKPYPFCLAYALDTEPQSLGDPGLWLAERKWDGIRGQLIVRNDSIFVWSRGEELVTEKFPELQGLKSSLPSGTVIDGEILPFDGKRALPFNVLQTRIGRKNITPKILLQAPVVLMAYDLLEFKGEDIRWCPMKERREKLESLIENLTDQQSLIISPLVAFNSWAELEQERQQSRTYFSEGIMLKKKDSTYKSGRKRGEWWKWKVDPMTIDAVMIYAMRGHGRRANLYTDYTFAVWKGEELVPFAKAYSGLTDEEIRKVDQFVKRHTLERFGPVRSVKPELVFELAFEGINLSTRHKSGVALRFPRIHRWRHDKKPTDANSLEDLKELLNAYQAHL